MSPIAYLTVLRVTDSDGYAGYKLPKFFLVLFFRKRTEGRWFLKKPKASLLWFSGCHAKAHEQQGSQ
jgi:GTP-dependent phosphoenolpyruvate carboxykinase